MFFFHVSWKESLKMFKNMVLKEMKKNKKVKEAALKEIRELKRKTES